VSSLTAGLVASPSSQSQVGSGGSSDIVWVGFFFALVLVGVVISVFRARARSGAVAAFAARNRLRYQQSGSLADVPCSLFTRGHSRRWLRCCSGSWQGVDVRYADFRYTVGYGRDQHTYTCSVVAIPLGCRIPEVQVAPRNPVRALVEKIEGDEILFESDDFNRRFLVTAQDRRFAYELLDPRMLQAILDVNDDNHIDAGPTQLVVYGFPVCRPELLEEFIGEAVKIRLHVPAVVTHDYAAPAEAQ
jgi:hypothetical protein